MITRTVERLATRQKWLIIAFCLVGATIVLAWWFWPEPSLNAQARSIASDLASGNPTRIAELTIEELFSETGVTRKNARAVLEKIVLPEFAACTLSRDSGSLRGDELTSGTWLYMLRVDNGQELSLATQVFGTESRGRVSLLNVLKDAWLIRYVRTNNVLPEELPLAWLRGLEHDRQFLKDIGILGTWDLLNNRFWAWDELASNWRKASGSQR